MSFNIAIASGKGGTGKTTVSVNLYHQLSKKVNDILLFDCDVEEPNDLIFFKNYKQSQTSNVNQLIPNINTDLCTFCRACVEYCEFNAISVIPGAKFAEVNAGLCHSCGACSIACKHKAITEIESSIGNINHYQLPFGNGLIEGKLRIGSTMQTMLIKHLKKHAINSPNITLFDAPPGTSCPVVETVADMDYVILVTEPTPFGLYDLKLIVELLIDIKKPFGVIINKAGLGNNEVYDFIKTHNIELLGEIPFDQSYAAAYATGELINTANPEFDKKYQGIIEKLTRKISA